MTQMLFWSAARLLTVGMALGESVEHLRRASAGDPITIADYPYAALLVGTLDLDGVTHARHCSASIVAPYWLLTAAHCLYDQNDEGYRMDTFEAIVNSSIRGGAKGSQEVYGAQTFIAPGFDIKINKSRGDIALIKLKEPIVFGDNGGSPSAITLPKPAGWLRKSAVRHHIVKWTDYVTLDGPPALLTDVSQYCDFIEKTTGQELCVDVPELK
ncbi:unnamed protein product, partial [Mesorhabditis spiculigera]